MAKDPALLWYWSDWNSGTSLFSRHQKGCYMDLLHAQFTHGRLSLEEIKTVLGSDFGLTWSTLQKKFKHDEKSGLFFNERLENEQLKRKAFTESRRNNLNSKPPDMGNHMKDHMSNHMENRNENKDNNSFTKKSEKKIDLVFPFDTDDFKAKWSIWLEYRTEIKKPYKSIKSQQGALKQLSEYTEEFACHLIDKSIASGWQGLVFESTKKDCAEFYGTKQISKHDNIRNAIAEAKRLSAEDSSESYPEGEGSY